MKVLHILAACLLMWVQVAWGHAVLVSSSPAQGAVLNPAPAAVSLTFSEPVSVTALRLLGPQGSVVDVVPVEAGGRRIRVPLPGGAAPGTYLLSWRVVSADGHPVGGSLDYAVGVMTAPPMLADAAGASGGRQAAIWLGRWLGYACLFFCVGAALFRTRNPSDRQAWVWFFIWFGLGLLPVNLGLQGLDLLDAPVGALFGWPAWAAALGSRYAWTLGLSALALLASAWALCARRIRMVQGCAGLGLVLVGVAFAASGHAGTASPQWLSRPLVVVHGMAAAAWLGALVPLARMLDVRPKGCACLAVLAWFSRWIVPTVIVLLASGVGLALLQLAHVGDLWRTPYGIVLSVKLVLVCGLLVIAAFNRWHCTGLVLAGEPSVRGRLRRSIVLETIVAVALLGVVSLWRFTPPPRTLVAAESAGPHVQEPASFILLDDRVHAIVTRQEGAWFVVLSNPAGEPFRAQGLTLVLRNPQAGIEPLRRRAQRLDDGRWRVKVGPLPLSGIGHWRLGLEVLVDDFEQLVLEGPLPH